MCLLYHEREHIKPPAHYKHSKDPYTPSTSPFASELHHLHHDDAPFVFSSIFKNCALNFFKILENYQFNPWSNALGVFFHGTMKR